MKKIDAITETIFSHAVALESSGRLKNTIYGIKNHVFVLNSDHTVLLRFTLPRNATPFKKSISFKADDYDSSTFYEEDGLIVFVQKSGDMTRKKFCGKAPMSPEEVEGLFDKYDLNPANSIAVHKDTLSLLNDSLSHIEISGKKGSPIIIQRDIFSGNIIELQRDKVGGFGISKKDDIKKDFGPLGLRTGDFMALFAFNDEVTFQFKNGPSSYSVVNGKNFDMVGVVSLCLYDEMGGITYTDTAGILPGKIDTTPDPGDGDGDVWVYHPGSDNYAIVPQEALINPTDDLEELGPAVFGDLPELELLIREVYDGQLGREE